MDVEKVKKTTLKAVKKVKKTKLKAVKKVDMPKDEAKAAEAAKAVEAAKAAKVAEAAKQEFTKYTSSKIRNTCIALGEKTIELRLQQGIKVKRSATDEQLFSIGYRILAADIFTTFTHLNSRDLNTEFSKLQKTEEKGGK